MASDEKLTPFMIFFCEQKASIVAQNPSAKPAEIARKIFELWQGTTSEVARAYSVLSAAYAESKKTGPSTSSAVKRKRKLAERDPKAPKAGMNKSTCRVAMRASKKRQHRTVDSPSRLALRASQRLPRTCTLANTTGLS